MTAGRYTTVPSPQVEALLDDALVGLRADLEPLGGEGLCCVVLGGGYGRGEGGVLHSATGDCLYNDLDLFAFADGAGHGTLRRLNARLREVAEPWEKRLGVSVDFSPVKNLASLPHVSRTLMYQELLRGFKPVWGRAELAHWIPELAAEDIPFSEAARLFLNRGMGLVFAGERLAKGDSDADFIVRNMNKLVLGCGDALLAASGRYRWKGAERVSALAEYCRENGMGDELQTAYADAFRYKLEPLPVLPENPLRRWKRCRGFFLDAVRRVAEVGDEADVGAVRRGLERRGARERSATNFLRWLLRARSVRSIERLFDAPVVTLAGMLYEFLASHAEYAPCPERLYRLWCRFN